MKQSVKLFLLAVLFCAWCVKAQDEVATDPGSDEEATDLPEENGTNQADGSRAGRIVKGSIVSITDYPYVATVISSSTSVTYATGAIISNTRVLTSAALFTFISSDTVFTVRAGSNYQDKEGKVFPMQNYNVHSQYNMFSKANDVAVVTIQGTFAGVPNVQPIAIQTTDLDPASPNLANCFILGWGWTGSATAVNLKKAEFKLITNVACASTYRTVEPSQQCAQSVTGFACYDDNGAPLVCGNRLYGTFIFVTCNPTATQATQKFTKLTAPSIQSFLSSFPPETTAVQQPRKNYLTCPCTAC